MGLFDLFKNKGVIRALIVPNGIPPHKKSIVSICLFKVDSANAPHPFEGAPPAEAMIDTVDIREASDPLDKPLEARVERPPGYYHIQVTYIAFFHIDDKWTAQVERFFPNESASHVAVRKETAVKLEFFWPDIPLNELGLIAIFQPGLPPLPARNIIDPPSTDISKN